MPAGRNHFPESGCGWIAQGLDHTDDFLSHSIPSRVECRDHAVINKCRSCVKSALRIHHPHCLIVVLSGFINEQSRSRPVPECHRERGTMSLLRLRYQTLEFDTVDIHIRSLRDTRQFSDDHGTAEKLGISSAVWPLFGVIWISGEILAHLMEDFQIEGKRILEMGCGIGLASLMLNHRHADITATDYHPEAESFLAENVRLNQGETIPFVRTDWDDRDSGMGRFDLLIGSDLLYEAGHISQLSAFIDHHAAPHCDIILVDPGRGNHARFSKKMVALGYSHSQTTPASDLRLTQPFNGKILRYHR